MTNRYPTEDYLNTELPQLRSITMPTASKERMKLELAAYADLHAVRPAAIRSPFSSVSFMPASFWRISGALAALLLMVGGSAYASTDALPGSALYPVKVDLAEPLQTALIPDAKGKAAWHAILAERRLDEATKLAVAGKLDADTEHDLTSNFSQQVSQSVAAADEVQATGDVSSSLALRSDLDARLSAHEDILAQVVDHLSEDGVQTETDTSAQDLLAVVSKKQDAVEGTRLALETSLNSHAAAADAAAQNSDSNDSEVAINDDASAKIAAKAMPMMAPASGATVAADVQTANTARTMEVSSILAKYAPLLTTLNASTTATTTATSTEDSNTDSDSINGDVKANTGAGARKDADE